MSISPDLPSIRRRLLAWFRKHARDLPWRQDRDPYRVWVSEVMLQQTQVATVIPYFHRFLESFPTLADLAQANEADVLRRWAGLGYYRRARDLLRAAQELNAAGHATVPDDPDLLRTLPGFGRYTANAVLSQAYERRLPIVEANSQRLLCRLFGIEDDPKQTAVQKQLWQLAEQLLPRTSIGAFNQALMELGALVCTPSEPKCDRCPLHQHCQARRDGRQDQIPRRGKPVSIEAVEEVAVVLRRQDEVLLVQRPGSGRWAGMWECPHHECEWLETHTTAVQRLLTSLKIEGEIRSEVATIRHGVTRFRITMVCVEVEYRSGTIHADAYPNWAWVKISELHRYPLSTPQRRLAERLDFTSP
jgi:A/G-specific adenine glycosylase